MGNLGYAARVGIVVLITAFLFGYMVYFFKKYTLTNKTYRINVAFSDASGIRKDVDVTMAGVKIGEVHAVQLVGLRADAQLDIIDKYKIPVGSQFLINIPTLGDVGTISVVPPAAPTGQVILAHTITAQGLTGEQAGNLQSSLNNANKLMDQFQVTIGKVNKLLDQTSEFVSDPHMANGLRESIMNLQQASRNGLQLTDQLNKILYADNNQIAAILNDTRKGSHAALNNITATTADLRTVTRENKQQLGEIIQNMSDTTAALEGITSQTNDMLKNGGVTKNLSAVVANLKETTAKLDAMTGDLKTITGDAATQGDIKAMVHNLRATTEQTSLMVERINHLIGVKPKPDGKGTSVTPATDHPAAPLILPHVEMLQNTRDNRFRMDVGSKFKLSSGNFVDLGIFGVGDNNRLDLEYGTLAGAGSIFDYRGGFHASKLAVGADVSLGRDLSLSADLYDPNHGHLDLHGVLMLNPSIGLIAGSDNVTHRPSAVVGIELRK